MNTAKIIVLAVLIAIFILLVGIDGRRKIKKRDEMNNSSGSRSVNSGDGTAE